MKTIEIEIAVDHEEAEEFAEFLNCRGFAACVGMTTGNFVDGQRTDRSEEASIFLNLLWEDYCQS